jgi:AGCS family alanine or glycine:cation symporter
VIDIGENAGFVDSSQPAPLWSWLTNQPLLSSGSATGPSTFCFQAFSMSRSSFFAAFRCFLVVLMLSLSAGPAWADDGDTQGGGEPAATKEEGEEPAKTTVEREETDEDVGPAAGEGSELGKQIRTFAKPVVDAAADVMFWDPFAAIGLYDPVLRDDAGKPIPERDENGEVVLDENGQPVPKKTNFPIVVIWLISIAAFFTLRLKFINFRGFRHALELIRGHYHDPTAPGQVTHFQALSTALSGTVGLGNIAGVALAVSIGGPGATFWMIVAGLLGMATKFAECTLGLKYREVDENGEVSGGPMYYLRKALANREIGGVSLAPLGVALGGTWAFLAMFGSLGGGNMFQANQSYVISAEVFPALQGLGPYFGMVLAFFVGVVIVGGISGIGKFTGRLVPSMAILYMATSLFIIAVNIGNLPEVVRLIVTGAFDAPAAKGGFIGVMVMGLRRAAFSNEAGVGTAAIAHSAAQTREPVAEGLVALHEPFVDTVVICTITSLVLIFTGFHQPPEGMEGVAITASAFGSVFSWFPYILTIAILLFSFSTLISFAYYGTTCFDFLFGDLFEKYAGNRDYGKRLYQMIFLLATVVGCSASIRTVMDFADMIIFGLIATNTIGLLILSGEVAGDLKSYFERVESGEIKPTDE